jgi:glycosyltransferase involved in cell wall biosynthesis
MPLRSIPEADSAPGRLCEDEGKLRWELRETSVRGGHLSRPTILFLAPVQPYPLSSGLAMRQFHLLRAYSTIADVEVAFFFRETSELPSIRTALAPYCRRLHPVPYPEPEGRSDSVVMRVRQLRQECTWRPHLAHILRSTEMSGLVADLAKSTEIIHVGRLQMAHVVDPLLKCEKRTASLILDLDDVESAKSSRTLRVMPRRRWWSRGFEYCDLVRIWAYEKWAVNRFDRVFVCSAKDRARFRRPNVIVVPNGIDLPDEVLPKETPSDGRTILFCGALSYWPNGDAVRFFVGQVFPEIRRRLPDTRLLIVGRSVGNELTGVADGTSVQIEANVPSIAPYYRRASVAIAPLRVGGGTRIKILEAWAFGVPVVSTSIGAEGLQGIHGQELLIADTPQAFARACVSLLESRTLRARLAQRARQLVLERYRWDIVTLTAKATVDEVSRGVDRYRTSALRGSG